MNTAPAGQHAFSVVVELGTLTRSASGQIAGVVYVRLGGVAFPEADWSDSVVTVLTSWAEELNALRRGAERAVWHFMDGPFRVDLTPDGDDQYFATCMRADGRREVAVATSRVPGAALATALRDAVSAVTAACEQRGWQSRDIAHLYAQRARLARR